MQEIGDREAAKGGPRGHHPRGHERVTLLDRIVERLCPDDLNFERPLRIIFLSFLAVTVFVLTMQNIVAEYRNLREPQDAIVATAERILMQQRALGSHALDEIVSATKEDTDFKQAIQNRDAGKIQQFAKDVVTETFDDLNILALEIFDADGTNLTRAPGTALQIASGHSTGAEMGSMPSGQIDGIVLGPNNRFAVTVVKPWLSNNQLQGYLKLVIGIENSLALASTALDAQIVKICEEARPGQGRSTSTKFKVLGNLSPKGMKLDVFAKSGQDLTRIHPFYMQDSKIFMVRDLPIAVAQSEHEFKLLLVKDITGNVWAFFNGVIISVLIGAGLSLIAWAVIHRLLSRLQNSVQITRERLEAEVRNYTDKLENNASKLLEAQRIATVGSWERNVATNEISATEEYFRIMNIPAGLPSDEIIERVYSQIPEHEAQAAKLMVQNAIETCGEFDFEHSLVTGTEPPRALHIRGYVLPGPDGKGARVVGTVHDITERIQAEQKNNLLADILESSLNEIYIVEAESFRIEHANKCALSNLGYQIGELKSLRLWDVNPLYTKEAIQHQVRPLLNGELEGIASESIHKRRDGSEYPVDLRVQLFKDKDQSLFVIIANDVTERVLRETETREARVRAERLAYFDQLTKLSNRAGCQRDAKQRFAQDDKPAFLVHVDMDNFKRVNDTLGHLAGDYCLEETGRRLREVSRGLATAYRWGGDEFVVIAEASTSDPNELCERARRLMRLPMDFNGHRFWPTVSMGIALCPDDATNFEDLLFNADLALYQSKENGKDRFTFFRQSMKTESETEARIERELQKAVKENQFFMVYQPQVNLRSQSITGIEALIRWDHPERGILSPGEFLPIVERTSLAPLMGEIIIDRALAAARYWLDTGLDFGRISVNVSPSHLASGLLVDHFKAGMKKYKIEPNRITAEVLESVFLSDNPSGHLAALRELFELGVHIELDDFGTGYASLTHVADLPINGLKIDKSFTNQMIDDPRKEAVVNQLVHLARSLNIAVVCEGVETEAQYHRLRMMGDFSIQGYLIAEPMPLDQMTEWMTEASDDLYFVI
ncbi:EAL domain-containing protein [Roseibium sp. HPY-6]|uniref:sensor domain-containing protein n=1 Tax=Roseibium sp. HPY-6 TaxID=3229852 RepID=UPI00338EDD43